MDLINSSVSLKVISLFGLTGNLQKSGDSLVKNALRTNIKFTCVVSFCAVAVGKFCWSCKSITGNFTGKGLRNKLFKSFLGNFFLFQVVLCCQLVICEFLFGHKHCLRQLSILAL